MIALLLCGAGIILPLNKPTHAARALDASGDDLEDLELWLLLEAVHRRHGLDFRDYAATSLRRRLRHHLHEEGLGSLSVLQDRVLHDPSALQRLAAALSVSVTSMFRDPAFFASFRHRVVPLLRTYPTFRIWHAGCATGEEVWSMAILLEEEGLSSRTRIWGTDMSEAALARARSGRLPLATMQANTTNYLLAGGKSAFSQYYAVEGAEAVLDRALHERVVFAAHNLVTDGSFNDFHVVLCRNVLIYFNRTLQDRVHALLHQSLVRLGVLGLGARETLRFSACERSYQELDDEHRLYRKVA